MKGTLTLTTAVSNHIFSWCNSLVICPDSSECREKAWSPGWKCNLRPPKGLKKNGEEQKYDRELQACCHFCLWKHFVNVCQRNHLKLLTSAGADAGLDCEFIGSLAGASQRWWLSMVLVTAQISWHCQEEHTRVILKMCLWTSQTTACSTWLLSSSLFVLGLILHYGKLLFVTHALYDSCHIFQTRPGMSDGQKSIIPSQQYTCKTL